MHLLAELEMIIFGWFDEFEERSINAFYEGGTLYISHLQDDTSDLYDDVIHEIAHSSEEPYGYFLYGDKKMKKSFFEKESTFMIFCGKWDTKPPPLFL